jgi:hypothetical protein
MRAIVSSMVVLMVPAFLICTGIAVLAYRRRNRSAGD